MNTQITIGIDNLSVSKFKKVNNYSDIPNKPSGGLWSSTFTLRNKYCSDWHRYCDEVLTNRDTRKAVLFNFKNNTRIYRINLQEDLINLVNQYGQYNHPANEMFINFGIEPRYISIDFENVSKYYDVIHLTKKGMHSTRSPFDNRQYNLYTWDVECSFIMNFDCINDWKPIIISKK